MKFIFCVLLVASSLGAENDAWSVGLSSVKITPEKPVVLAGYAARTKPFEKVDQDLFAKAMALQDSAGNRAVLVTFDICILPKDVAEQIRQRIAEKTKLEPAAILLSASHTHSGPAVSLKADTTAGQVNPGTTETVEYTHVFQDKLVAVAEAALAQMKPAKLSYGGGVANFVMNRREFTPKGVILGVNARGLTDRSVPILRVDTPDGKLRAVLFACACHNTTVPSKSLGVCADYAGYAREYIEKQFPDAQAMFMMGCGGDANPYPRNLPNLAPLHGEELGKEVCRVLETKLQPVRGPLKCAAEIASLPLKKFERATLETMAKAKAGLDQQTARQMLAILDKGETPLDVYRAPVAAWQFGEDLTLIGLPEEVVVDYVQLLEKAVGPLKLWVAGYCHEVTGYVPSRRVLREGGYETRGLYIDAGIFAPETEDELVRAAKKAAVDAGRKMDRPD